MHTSETANNQCCCKSKCILEWIIDKIIFDKIACIYCRFISLVLLLFVFSCCVDRVALDTLAALLKSSKFLNTRNNSN